MTMKPWIIILLAVCIHADGMAQHEHHNMDMMHTEMKDTLPADDKLKHDTMMSPMDMSHAYSPYLPMNRNGSGTGWLPDASPMYGAMFHTRKWMYMLHGNLFLRYNNQDPGKKGSRGGSEFDAPDWLMLMGQRRVGKNGLFHFNTMFSLDAALGGNDGYPLLFQSGEAYKGKSIVDRQHPHDLFSELSVSYSQALSPKADVFLYLGYPGEPALGPVAFMHRPSALSNPDAPLSHHWTDATHVTFGVATIGARYGAFKLEASSFTGREPDENRYNFDKPRFDSWSSRLSFNPSANWALQVSHGVIKSPELLHPGEDVHRTTASAIYSRPISNQSAINAALVWGMNKTAGHNGEHSLLAEAEWRQRKWAVYGRYEWVQKSVEELALDEITYGHDAVFPVNSGTVGLSYDVLQSKPVRIALGAQGTLYHSGAALSSLYGKNPAAFELYLRVYPGLMR